MQYMALIYSDEERWESLPADEREGLSERYLALAREMRERGVLAGGERLSGTRDATTVRVRDAETLVVDGPYAEVKEALGGFFLLECGSEEEALDWAARIPAAESGAVEVRPLHASPEEEQL